MKYTIILPFLLIIYSKAFSQKFNTDAISRFWQVVDYLKADNPLDDSLWYSYYNLEGNKKYMENNRDQESALEHRKYLELIFRPSFSDSLLRFENNNTAFSNDIFENLNYVKLNEEKLRLYTKQITSPDYLAFCIDLAKKFLPKNKFNAIPKSLTIYIQAITFDAAVQGSSMYFGITRIYEYDKFKKGLIAAHEFHHILRINKGIQNNISQPDSASFSIIDQINNEGCADLIDKTIALENEATIFRGHGIKQRLIDIAEIAIKKLDSCFILNANSTKQYITDREFSRIT